MKTSNLFAAASAALLFGLSTTPASAISSEGFCEVSDVQTDAYGNANSCYGLFAGNIETSGTFAYTTQLAGWASYNTGGAWSVLGDITFDTSDHTWTANGSFSELIIVLKQSTMWGAWYFNPADDEGTWSTSWVFTQGNPNDPRYSTEPGGGLSHGFALVRGESTTVPEPGTLALLGLGLLGVGLAGRRRKA